MLSLNLKYICGLPGGHRPFFETHYLRGERTFFFNLGKFLLVVTFKNKPGAEREN